MANVPVGGQPETYNEKVEAELASIYDELSQATKANWASAEDVLTQLSPKWRDLAIKAELMSPVSPEQASKTPMTETSDREQIALLATHSFFVTRHRALNNRAWAEMQIVKGSAIVDSRPVEFTPTRVHSIVVRAVGRNSSIFIPFVDGRKVALLAEIIWSYRELVITERKQPDQVLKLTVCPGSFCFLA